MPALHWRLAHQVAMECARLLLWLLLRSETKRVLSFFSGQHCRQWVYTFVAQQSPVVSEKYIEIQAQSSSPTFTLWMFAGGEVKPAHFRSAIA